MRVVIALALALLAGCGRDEPEPRAADDLAAPAASDSSVIPAETSVPASAPSSPRAAETGVPPQPSPASLRGEWRLAGVDGQSFDAPFGVAVSIGANRIDFDNCQQVAWNYTYDAPRLTTQRTPAITIDINPKPLPCAAPLPPQVARMVNAIDRAEQVERTPENGLRIVGPGDASVLLFRQ